MVLCVIQWNHNAFKNSMRHDQSLVRYHNDERSLEYHDKMLEEVYEITQYVSCVYGGCVSCD